MDKSTGIFIVVLLLGLVVFLVVAFRSLTNQKVVKDVRETAEAISGGTRTTVQVWTSGLNRTQGANIVQPGPGEFSGSRTGLVVSVVSSSKRNTGWADVRSEAVLEARDGRTGQPVPLAVFTGSPNSDVARIALTGSPRGTLTRVADDHGRISLYWTVRRILNPRITWVARAEGYNPSQDITVP